MNLGKVQKGIEKIYDWRMTNILPHPLPFSSPPPPTFKCISDYFSQLELKYLSRSNFRLNYHVTVFFPIKGILNFYYSQVDF